MFQLQAYFIYMSMCMYVETHICSSINIYRIIAEELYLQVYPYRGLREDLQIHSDVIAGFAVLLFWKTIY